MASRALTTRFMMTCSIWPGSALMRPRAGSGTVHQVDGLPDQSLDHRLHARHDAVEVEHLGREHLLAAEGEKLARERGPPDRAASRMPSAFLRSGMGGGETAKDEIAVAPV
jgi:hypothetical protein